MLTKPLKIGRSVYNRLLSIPGVASSLRHAQGQYATIFMLHRLGDAEHVDAPLEPHQLRGGLEYLRRHGFELVSLTELFQRLAGNGPKLRGAVAFTVDDGYRDQAEIVAPIFREYDCPVTAFVATGFLDGDLWLWWDKVEYIFSKTRHTSLAVRVGEAMFEQAVNSRSGLHSASGRFIERCKAVDDEEKDRAIARLAEQGEVDVPTTAPPWHAPMTWDQLRSCENQGMSFGPHSVSHPILSRTRSEAADWEITESWRRLQTEARSPVPIFCYPNGADSDFGEREIEILRDNGLIGALTAESGWADVSSFRRSEDAPFMTRRVAFPTDLSVLVRYVSGAERLKQRFASW